MKQIARVLALACIAVGVWASAAGPCSCITSSWARALVKSGAILPSNARGIPCVDMHDVSRWQISVKRLDRRSPPVPFELETVEFPEGYAKKVHSYVDDFSLLCPRWEPGGAYRISIADKSIEVTIARQPFVPDSCSVDVWESEFGSVTSMTRAGSCNVTFPAYRLGIEMSGGVVERWGESLLYLTIVDDELAWRPTKSLCSDVPAGWSWVGPMRELLYCECYREGGTRFSPAEWVLTPGEHEVTMIAWLPGVACATATREVSLDCGAGH